MIAGQPLLLNIFLVRTITQACCRLTFARNPSLFMKCIFNPYRTVLACHPVDSYPVNEGVVRNVSVSRPDAHFGISAGSAAAMAQFLHITSDTKMQIMISIIQIIAVAMFLHLPSFSSTHQLVSSNFNCILSFYPIFVNVHFLKIF